MLLKRKSSPAENLMCLAIQQWRNDKVGSMRGRVLARCAGESLSPGDMQELASLGLVDENASWTPLGAKVADLLVHELWLENDEVQEILASHQEECGGAVLDVGCSSGGTLRRMSQSSLRVGVDIDDVALALGRRLARCEGQKIEFRPATADRLPFDDESFDCVICRNAITYMHQRHTLREMTRVLRPGGLLLLRFENFRYDIQRVLNAKGARALVCRFRDLVFGVINAATGWQPESNGRLSPGRTFGTARRLGQHINATFRVLDVVESRQCPRLLGGSSQTSLLARKLGLPRPYRPRLRERAERPASRAPVAAFSSRP